MSHDQAGRRFRTFFTAVCVDLRSRAHASEELVAAAIGVRGITIQRFEQGDTFPSDNLERFAAGYAALVTPPLDPRDVFERAVQWWRQAGLSPVLDGAAEADEPTASDVIGAIRQAERRSGHAQAAAPPSATRRRRAGGR